MREVKERAGTTVIDPIDALVPRPRHLAVRLAIASLIVGLVGVGAWLFGAGTVYPQPDCCGSGDGGGQMSVALDRVAVQINVIVANSSGHPLRGGGADAVLPGADVLDVGAVPDAMSDGFQIPFEPQPLPTRIESDDSLMVVLTFVPTSCEPAVMRSIDVTAWGELWLDLEVDENGLLPSFGRRYRVPGYVVDAGARSLSLFATDDRPVIQTGNPIVAACALLGR